VRPERHPGGSPSWSGVLQTVVSSWLGAPQMAVPDSGVTEPPVVTTLEGKWPIAFRTESVIASRYKVARGACAPGAKSATTTVCPKKDRPSSKIAQVMRAQTSLVYASQMEKHSWRSRTR
jgi:hypothetical protein